MDGLFHGYTCAGGSVEQPLKMIARKLVIRVRAEMGGKCCNRAWIVCLQFGECCEIGLGRVAGPRIGRQGFDSAHRFGPTSEKEVTDRSAVKIGHLSGYSGTDANPGSELLIGGFQPRRDVDRVAIGGVVEEA